MMGALVAVFLASIASAILSPIWPDIHPAWTIGLITVALLSLHRVLLYCEGRGWIYYLKGRGSHGGLGVTSDFLNMYDPSRKHLQDTVREVEWKRDEDDDGDRPTP